MLFDGMRENYSLARINLSSNSLGSESCQALCTLLSNMSGQPSPLNSIDLSGNDLGEEDAQELCNALENNVTVVCLDCRANQIDKESENMLEIERIVRRNELDMRR
jgi:Ran GTPase-activating protein (RanGAP) involved in mRNA processing and transport